MGNTRYDKLIAELMRTQGNLIRADERAVNNLVAAIVCFMSGIIEAMAHSWWFILLGFLSVANLHVFLKFQQKTRKEYDEEYRLATEAVIKEVVNGERGDKQ